MKAQELIALFDLSYMGSFLARGDLLVRWKDQHQFWSDSYLELTIVNKYNLNIFNEIDQATGKLHGKAEYKTKQTDERIFHVDYHGDWYFGNTGNFLDVQAIYKSNYNETSQHYKEEQIYHLMYDQNNTQQSY